MAYRSTLILDNYKLPKSEINFTKVLDKFIPISVISDQLGVTN